MSEEQAVYNAKETASRVCAEIADRFLQAARWLDIGEMVPKWHETQNEVIVLMRIGERIEEVNKVILDAYDALELAESEHRIPAGTAKSVLRRIGRGWPVEWPKEEQTPPAFLCELGARISQRRSEIISAAMELKNIARKLGGEKGGSEE